MTCSEGNRDEPRGQSRFWLWWLAFSIALLGFSAYFSSLAPAGAWPNEISGASAWMESDPGSIYVASAHELSWREAPLFVGHPGTTLTPLLRGVQAALFFFNGGEATTFTRFTAQNLPTVFFASKMMMTILHLISIAAIYALAKRLLRDDRAATIAAFAYATSFPVLYFASRISVEPLMISFFALSFIAIWRYQDAALRGHRRSAIGFAALAGVASVSGALTKLNFLGPLPFFIGLYLLAGRETRSSSSRVRARTCALAFVGFSLSACAAFALYTQLIDWGLFAEAWRWIARKPIATQWTLGDFALGLGSRHILLSTELALSIFGAASWFLLLRRTDGRERVLWFSAYGIYGFLLFAYRIALEGDFLPFHYFFLSLATLAVFFGWGTVQLAQRVGIPTEGATATLAAILWLSAVHGLGGFAAAESRFHDAEMYEYRRPAFELLAGLGPTDRVGVALPPGSEAILERRIHSLHGMVFPVPWDPRPSQLRDEILSLFEIAAPERISGEQTRVLVPVLESEAAILPRR